VFLSSVEEKEQKPLRIVRLDVLQTSIYRAIEKNNKWSEDY
jgi:hypothetical protein